MAHKLIDELRAACGEDNVVTHPHQLRTYESDGLLRYRGTRRSVMRRGSAEEVQKVLRACHRAEVPWVARGSGTGLSGGALPVEEGIVIGVNRMNRVLEVDLPNQRI